MLACMTSHVQSSSSTVRKDDISPFTVRKDGMLLPYEPDGRARDPAGVAYYSLRKGMSLFNGMGRGPVQGTAPAGETLMPPRGSPSAASKPADTSTRSGWKAAATGITSCKQTWSQHACLAGRHHATLAGLHGRTGVDTHLGPQGPEDSNQRQPHTPNTYGLSETITSDALC